MNRLIAAASLLSLSSTARADIGIPWQGDRVPVRVTITVGPPPPGVGLLLVSDEPGNQRQWGPRVLTAGTPVVLESRDRRFSFDVYVAPSESIRRADHPLRGFDGSLTQIPDRVHVGRVYLGGRLPLFDGRSLVEVAYHVERQGESMVLVKVSDNAPSWWQSGSCILVVLSAVIALIGLGVRLARSRPVPPPEGRT